MKKFFTIISYYILLLIGLIGTSWIIWSRFIRERVIRDIPDALLTEYRIWILVYICSIYLFTIKNLVKPIKSNIIFQEINKYIWKPLIILDHTLKYNRYCKPYYNKIIVYIIDYWSILSINLRKGVIISFTIIPRIILVTFLLMDTFYFNKLEVFYKIVLIGLLPFGFRYFEYSCKDFYDYLVKQLTDKYEKVYIFEKGYSYDISRKGKTEAVWHYDFEPVEKFIEIMHETPLDCIRENTSYEYEGDPYCKNEVYIQYEQKFNKHMSTWTSEDYKEVDKLFHDLIPYILDLKRNLNHLNILKEEKIIIWVKIGIYSIYLICWCYILLVSYFNYPIELKMFKNLIFNFVLYLIIGDGEDPFIGLSYSFNENLVTIENVKNLIINIKNVMINKIKNIF